MLKSISAIADDLQTSRQYVYQTLQAALKKVYKKLKVLHPQTRPFDIVCMIAKEFKVFHEKDFERFYADFPMSIRKEVTADAMKLVRVNPGTTLDEILLHNIRATKRWPKEEE